MSPSPMLSLAGAMIEGMPHGAGPLAILLAAALVVIVVIVVIVVSLIVGRHPVSKHAPSRHPRSIRHHRGEMRE